MKDNFEKVIPWLYEDEGEYSNDAHDPGGPTRLGITYIDYARWLKVPENKVTAKMVKEMPVSVVNAIYKMWYWDEVSADQLPSGIDYFVCDSGLLSGVGKARHWLQQCSGVTTDGIIGPVTLSAVAAREPKELLASLVALRRRYLRSLAGWRHFGRGWTNRVNKVNARAQKIL